MYGKVGISSKQVINVAPHNGIDRDYYSWQAAMIDVNACLESAFESVTVTLNNVHYLRNEPCCNAIETYTFTRN